MRYSSIGMRFGGILALGLIVSQSSCSSGGDSGPADLVVTDLSIDTAQIEVAHTIDVEAQVRGVKQSVALSFKILNQDDYDHNNDPANANNPIEIRQYDLEPPIQIDGPTNQVTARLKVPDDVVAGRYYLGAQIDPHGLIDEPNDENNILIQELGYEFDDSWATVPNLILHEVVFEPASFTITRDSVVPSSGTLHTNHEAIGVRLKVEATGGQDLQGVQVGLSDIVLLAGDPMLPITIPDWLLAQLQSLLSSLPLTTDFLNYWNGALSSYMPYYTFDIAAGETKDLHLDVEVDYDELSACLAKIPDEVWDFVFSGVPPDKQWLRLQLDVTLALDPNDVIFEYEPQGYDNEGTASLGVTLDAQPPQCVYERGYDKTFGGSLFGVGVGAFSDVRFDPEGFHASAEVGVPIEVFGETFPFLDFQALGDRHPGTQISTYQLVLEFGGFPVFSHTIEDPDGFAWSMDLPFEKEKESKPKTFFPGGYPITVLGTIKGSIGIGVQASSGVTKDLLVGGGPFANLSVAVEGYPGIPGQAITLGVGAQLTLIEDRLNTNASADMTFSPGPACSYTGSLDFDVTNEISTLNGSLYVWIEIDWPKFCFKWGFLPYPCGWKTKKFTHDIVKWNGLKIAEQLLIQKQCVTADPIYLYVCP